MDHLPAARELLPAWVVWSPLLALPAFFLLSVVSTGAGALITLVPFWRGAALPCDERSRLAIAPRQLTAFMSALAMVCGGLLGGNHPWPLCPVPPGVLLLLLVFCGYAGAELVSFLVERQLRGGGLSFREWLLGQALNWLLFRERLFILIVAFAFLPWTFTDRAWVVLGCAAGALLATNLGANLLLARALGLARPVAARAQTIVDQVSTELGRPTCLAYEVDLPIASARAWITPRRVILTTRLLRLLDDDELAAVTALQLAHLSEPWPAVAARHALRMAALLVLALVPARYSLGFFPALGLAGAYLLVWWLENQLDRRLAGRAAQLAGRLQGVEEANARAQLKIQHGQVAPDARGQAAANPLLAQRLKDIDLSRGLSRPRPDAALTVGLGVSLLLMLGGVVATVLERADNLIYSGPEAVVLRSLALGERASRKLSTLSDLAWKAGRISDALVLLAAAGDVSPEPLLYMARRVELLVSLGRCAEARAVLAEARSLGADLMSPEMVGGYLFRAANLVRRNCPGR